MFVEPDEAESKTTVKADPTAPARSSIRRQRTVRYSAGTRAHLQASSSSNTRRQVNSNSRRRQLADRRYLLEDIRLRNRHHTHHASAAAMMHEILDLEAALNHGNPSINPAADVAHAEVSRRSQEEGGQAPLRDALRYERPSERMSSSEITTTSGDGISASHAQTYSAAEFDELRSLPQLDDRRSPPPRYVATPPYTSTGSPARSPPRLYSRPLGSAAFTPGFPPAHRPLMDQSEGRLIARRTGLVILAEQISELRTLPQYREDSALASMLSDINAMIVRSPSELRQDYLLTETGYICSIRERVEEMAQRARSGRSVHSMHDNGLANLSLLRRMSWRGVNSSRSALSHTGRDDLDGLGDRQRSFSPDPVSWETMLTTIPPDDRIPSVHSSFTSASASASASASTSASSLGSNSASASSYGTLITLPSTAAEAEPCPATEASSSDGDSQGEDALDVMTPPRRRASMDFLTQANSHLDRIDSLSRRLEDQQASGEQAAYSRRTLQRETQLQRIEANLLRLEGQIEAERSRTAGWQWSDGARAGRERL
ncbi:MAG: hypothetical protein Q9217_000919 [Psora testacea]